MNKRLASALELAIAKYDMDRICFNRISCVGCPFNDMKAGEQKACDVLSWHDVGSEIARAYIAAKEKAGA